MEITKEILKNLKEALKKQNIEIESNLINVRRPGSLENGDYFTNIALTAFSKSNFKTPSEFAEKIVQELKENEDFKVETINGYINFYLTPKYLQKQVLEIIKLGEKYGSIDIGKGQSASVEYISANPTGPLHVGNARGGPIGDVIANTLEKAGFKVTREYLHNDVGGQVKKLGKAIYYLLNPNEKTEDEVSYQGEYLKELANKVKDELKTRPNLSKEEFSEKAGEAAVKILFLEIMEDIKAMGIKFDRVVAESELKKLAPEVISKLKDVKEQDSALWFAPNDEFLKDRETVVRKSDGEYTYFASDIVYHQQKCKENDLVIDVLGANHSGHVPRLKAAVKAMDFNPNKLSIILYQYVRIKRGDETIKMSKRAGNFITAREVLDEVGKDAFRFFLLMHKPQSHMDFDLELAKKKASDNPVFYVQYAHSRICSVFTKAGNLELEEINLTLLKDKAELDLLRYLLKFSDIVYEATSSYSVNVFTTYATEIASLFHKLYETHQIIGDDKELTLARLALLRATKITLKNTLDILGIEAPERM
jgi:arginyl-tRNA synthetase